VHCASLKKINANPQPHPLQLEPPFLPDLVLASDHATRLILATRIEMSHLLEYSGWGSDLRADQLESVLFSGTAVCSCIDVLAFEVW